MATVEPQSSMPLLEMGGVDVASAETEELVLIESVSWRIFPGEYWVIGGRPLSGKSDLLGTAGGLQRPKSGSVQLFGRDVAFLSETELVQIRLRVGFVFAHGGRLFHHLTVAENLALPICYHDNKRPEEVAPRVETTLRKTGLEEVAGLTPGRVARHLRHRIGLARALMLEPELLLLDNPLAGLDPLEMRWWFEFLDELAAPDPDGGGRPRKVTLAVTTDDLGPWAGRGRQFGIISGRQLRLLGGRAELAGYADPMVREWLESEARD